MGCVRLRIQDLVNLKGWTLEDLANRAGVHYGTLQNYSQNILSSVDLSIVYKIARALEATLEDLVVEVPED
jgi:putative transcriptional regulator